MVPLTRSLACGTTTRAGSRAKASLKSDALSSLMEPATTPSRQESRRWRATRLQLQQCQRNFEAESPRLAEERGDRGPSHPRRECPGSDGRASSWLLHRACEGGTCSGSGSWFVATPGRRVRFVALQQVRPTPGISCEAPSLAPASSASSPCWAAPCPPTGHRCATSAPQRQTRGTWRS